MSFDIENLGSPAFWDMLKSNPERLAKEVCSIDLIDLETTLCQHPPLRAWVTAAYETARIDEERAKWILNRTEAEILIATRKTFDGHTGKPKTVAVVNAEVETHEEVIAAKHTYLEKMRVRTALEAMVRTLTDRKDMLVQIAAKHRQEAQDFS